GGHRHLSSGGRRKRPHLVVAGAGTLILTGSGRGCDLGVVVQNARPASGAGDAAVDSGGSRAVPVDVAVLELDPGLPVELFAEGDFELAGAGQVGVVDPRVPLGGDLPGDDDPARRVAGQHGAPLALAAVDAAFVVAAADPRLEHGLGHLGGADVVAGPPAVVSLGEQRERP